MVQSVDGGLLGRAVDLDLVRAALDGRPNLLGQRRGGDEREAKTEESRGQA